MYKIDVTFEKWMKLVDSWLVRFFGAGHENMPYAPWKQWYDEGLEPEDAFHEYDEHNWVFPKPGTEK
jgi:hypothetical protein